MDHSNVSFISLGDGLVASTKQLAFDGKLPVDAVAKALLCVRHVSGRLVGKWTAVLAQATAVKRGASGIEHRREWRRGRRGGRRLVAKRCGGGWQAPRCVGGDGRRCVASSKPWGNSQLSVFRSGWDGGGESIEKARSKLEKFRGFLLSPRE